MKINYSRTIISILALFAILVAAVGCGSFKKIDLSELSQPSDTGVIGVDGDIRGIQDFDAATRGATLYVKDTEGNLFYLSGVSPATAGNGVIAVDAKAGTFTYTFAKSEITAEFAEKYAQGKAAVIDAESRQIVGVAEIASGERVAILTVAGEIVRGAFQYFTPNGALLATGQQLFTTAFVRKDDGETAAGPIVTIEEPSDEEEESADPIEDES